MVTLDDDSLKRIEETVDGVAEDLEETLRSLPVDVVGREPIRRAAQALDDAALFIARARSLRHTS